MTATLTPSPAPSRADPRHATHGPRSRLAMHGHRSRLAPTLLAAALATAYVIVSPPSVDLAAHLFRARLFAEEGFGIWDNLWYSGHDIAGYGVLFPAVSAALSPQLAAAMAATATAAVFEPLARRHFGSRASLGALLFGAATAIDLYTGRLALAFGALPALGAISALDRGAGVTACALALVSALCSPVAALFTALAAIGYAVGAVRSHRRARPGFTGAAVAVAALAPVALLTIAFPEGGSEPFGLGTMLPVLALAAIAIATSPAEAITLRAGVAVYALATVTVYLVASPIGSNIARLGTLLAAPLAALMWWRRRTAVLLVAGLPLLYVGWAAPVRDVLTAAGDPSVGAAYYKSLLSFLSRESAPPAAPFRIEIPLTRTHWEAYRVATRFALARGWERQLDIEDNPLFYGGHLSAGSYAAWLHRNAVRFVALPDAALDYSARGEAALVRHGMSYLRLVMRSAHWRVYAVAGATPIAQGVATLTGLGPDWLSLRARSAGTVLVRVRFTPFWALRQGSGCVAPDGPYTRLTLRRPGPVRLVTLFSLARIGAVSPRCR